MNTTTNNADDIQQQEPIISNTFKLGGKGTVPLVDVFEVEPPPLDQVINGLVAGTVGSIIGSGGTGKGFFVLSVLADLATGRNFCGLDINELSDNQSACLITLEDPKAILQHRLYNLGSLLDAGDRIKFQRKIHIESMSGGITHLIDSNGNVNQMLLVQMAKALTGYRLVILDTLRRFHAGNENDSGHMSTLISCFEVIAEHTGAAILFLHHTNKTSTLTGASDQSSSRGASAITDNIRCQFNLTKMTEEDAEQYGILGDNRNKYVSIINSKTNYSESKSKIWLKRGMGGVLNKCEMNAQVIAPASAKRRLKGQSK